MNDSTDGHDYSSSKAAVTDDGTAGNTTSTDPTKPSPSIFSAKKYAAPFGRYEGPEPTEWPNNEFLVGRKNERTKLLNLLFTRGRKGAYLVTGHRGNGKTSFVTHCLEEYRSEVYGRFLRGNVGKAWILDRVGLVAVVAAILASLIILSDVGQFVLTDWQVGSHDWLKNVAVVPVLVVCAYPCFVAMELFEVCLSFGRDLAPSASPSPRAPWWGRPASFVFMALPAYALLVGPLYTRNPKADVPWWLPSAETLLENPLGVVSASTLAIAIMYALAEVTFALRARFRRETGLTPREALALLRATWLVALALACSLVWLLATSGIDKHPPSMLLYWSFCALASGLLAHTPSARPGAPVDVHESHRSWRWVQKLLVFFAVGTWTALRTDSERIELGLAAASLSLGLVSWILGATKPKEKKASPSPTHDDKSVDLDLSLQWARALVIVALKGMVMLLFGLQFLWVTLTPDQLDEKQWIGLALVLFFLIGYLESTWIVRNFGRSRAGVKLDPMHGDARLAHRERYQKVLTESTFFWFVFSAWLPVLTVSINLGIEKLDHRRVVESMMVGLREAYAEAFVRWRSVLANAGRALRFGVLVFMMTLVGDHLFSPPATAGAEWTPDDPPGTIRAAVDAARATSTGYYCRTQERRGLLGLLCPIGTRESGDDATAGEIAVDILRFDLLENPSATSGTGAEAWAPPDGPSPERRLFEYVLPTSYRCVEKPTAPNGDSDSFRCTKRSGFDGQGVPQQGMQFVAKHQLEFRVYHIFLLVLLYGTSRWFDKRWPLIPYRHTLDRINRVVDSLSSRMNEEGWSARGILSETVQRLIGPRLVVSKHTDPVDSRTVELEFLKIIHDIQDAALQLPFASRFQLSVPVPELIFVFDELDKVGARRRDEETAERVDPSPGEPFDEERERSRALHSLFADMKNILSSASARFLFIGGRNLHDEWLADQTARQPLLTRMFHAEVYIPTFLTDSSLALDPDARAWDIRRGTKLFIRSQAARAERLHGVWRRMRHGPWLSVGYDKKQAVSFEVAPTPPAESILTFFDCDENFSPEQQLGNDQASPLTKKLNDDLMTFLTYRSLGNVKRLKELFESFLREVEDAGALGDYCAKMGNCEHAVVIDDVARHRIQLIAAIYSHLHGILDQRPVAEDDKLAPAVFYLSDFLLKFHRRAFSRGNLERVDELVHIHRAPDLRGVLLEIVREWSGTILHPIRNGMYDFRFQSEVAQELRLASRGSEEELAALNFTLDESQSLKAMYRSRLKTAPRASAFELEAVLGELHEFDEEHETARQHYRSALYALDEQIDPRTASPGASPKVLQILSGTPDGCEVVRASPVWAIARVRLMLQIAMTYEHSGDLESAAAEYRNARSLANVAIHAMTPEPHGIAEAGGGDPNGSTAFISTLKHLHVLFQPALAEAWVAEKQEAGVDTGPALVEQDLQALRKRLPFVGDGFWDRAQASSASDVRHANFALTLAELHNKAGDLYFLKGRQVRSTRDVGFEGYLIRAHYHYAVSLQEVRSFLSYRRQSSGAKLGWPGDGRVPAPPTIQGGSTPDFAAQVASGSLTDLAEALIARTSFEIVVSEAEALDQPVADVASRAVARERLYEAVVNWFEADSSSDNRAWGLGLRDSFGIGTHELSIDSWLGTKPDSSEAKKGLLLKLVDDKSHIARLCSALVLSRAAARILAADSRLEDAAREAMQVVETICQLSWWWRLLLKLSSQAKGVKGAPALTSKMTNFLKLLFETALESLEEADLWWERVRGAPDDQNLRGVEGPRVPARATTLACSLGLISSHLGCDDSQRQRITKLIGKWSLNGTATAGHDSNSFRSRLEHLLLTHSFPMSNRVLGLRILIDDAVLGDGPTPADTASYVEELRRYANRHQAIMHFSPLHFATSIGAHYLLLERKKKSHGIEARNHVGASRQMYTMGPKYYELISDLYYLYDDFNDRRIHFSHAIQMAGADVATRLDIALEEALRPTADS